MNRILLFVQRSLYAMFERLCHIPECRWPGWSCSRLSGVGVSAVKLTDLLGRLVSASPLLVICVATAPIYLISLLMFSEPLEAAGLYVLMAELIADSHFALPTWVPYYGPGGIPFAYPPLGFYLAAGTTRLLGISLIEYTRLAPPLLGVLSTFAMYRLARRLTRSTTAAAFGAVLGATIPVLWYCQVTAPGVVRGLAYLSTLLGLGFTYDALTRAKPAAVAMAAVLFASTLATHLSYAVFYGVTVLFFALFLTGLKPIRRLLLGMAIGLGGLVLSAPWWLQVVDRHGMAVLWNSATTHDNMGFLRLLLHRPWELLRRLYWGIGGLPLTAATIIGGAVLVVRRQWLLPAWLLATMIFIGEGQRFVQSVAVLLVVSSLSQWLPRPWEGNALQYLPKVMSGKAVRVSVALVLALFSYANIFRFVVSQHPVLSPAVYELADWLRFQTSPFTIYAFLSDSHSEAEWLPYLARRTPLAGPWGAEWTGQYDLEGEYFGRLTDCARQPSVRCIDSLTSSSGIPPAVVILRSGHLPVELLSELEREHWSVTFRNDQFTAVERGPSSTCSSEITR